MFSWLRHLIRFCFSYVYIAHITWFKNKIWCRVALSHISFYRQQSQLNPIQINNDHILFNQSNLVYRAKCCIVDFEWMTWRQQWIKLIQLNSPMSSATTLLWTFTFFCYGTLTLPVLNIDGSKRSWKQYLNDEMNSRWR